MVTKNEEEVRAAKDIESYLSVSYPCLTHRTAPTCFGLLSPFTLLHPTSGHFSPKLNNSLLKQHESSSRSTADSRRRGSEVIAAQVFVSIGSLSSRRLLRVSFL
jgi:hypothetical protein